MAKSANPSNSSKSPTSKSSVPKPLSDDQVEILEGLLDEFESDKTDGHMEAEEMDGFLVAALTPLDIRGEAVREQVALWLPFMLGVDEDDERGNVDSELGDLIAKHAISLQYQLEHDTGLDPLLTVDDRDRVSGVGWAHGYLRGMALDMEFWEALIEDQEDGDFLDPMLILSGTPPSDDEPAPVVKEHQREALIDAMLGAAAFAYQWYRQR